MTRELVQIVNIFVYRKKFRRYLNFWFIFKKVYWWQFQWNSFENGVFQLAMKASLHFNWSQECYLRHRSAEPQRHSKSRWDSDQEGLGWPLIWAQCYSNTIISNIIVLIAFLKLISSTMTTFYLKIIKKVNFVFLILCPKISHV